MKKWLGHLSIFLLAPVIILIFTASGFAAKRQPIEGAGWPYPWQDSYAQWQQGNVQYDPMLFDQDVIESYGWEAKNVEEIKDLLPPMLYIIMSDPETYGPRRINITQKLPVSGPLWEKYKAATEKFKGTVTVDDQGWIQNYKAGCPFPNPRNGLELIWNFKKRFGEDDRILGAVTIITNKRGQVRYQTSDGNLMFLDGRLTDGEKYVFEPNPNNYSRIDVYANAHPYEMQGTLSFNAQFDNPGKDDYFWLYLPAMRRVRRLSASQRTDRLPGGQDIMWENLDSFNGSTVNYTFKILGQKEMLVVRNGCPKSEWIHGKHMPSPNDYYQKVTVYMNEMTPKDPNFMFSKVIHYTDPETWASYYSEWYDQKGRPYLMSMVHYAPAKNGIPVPAAMCHIDVQTVHSTGYCMTNPQYNVGLTPEYFRVDNLKKEYPAR